MWHSIAATFGRRLRRACATTGAGCLTAGLKFVSGDTRDKMTFSYEHNQTNKSEHISHIESLQL